MLNKIKLLSAFAAVALASGCYTINADLPGTVRGDVASTDTETVGQLAIEKGHTFYICGLVGAPGADFLQADIQREVAAKGGDGVANLTYDAQNTCGDVACTFFSLNIMAPRTYKVTGDIVKIKKAPLPGAPLSAPASAMTTTTTDAPTVAQNF